MVAGGLETKSDTPSGDGDGGARLRTGGCDGGNAAGMGCGGAAVGGGMAAKSCGTAGSKIAVSGGSKIAVSGGAKLLGTGAAKVGAGVLAKGAAGGLLAVEAGGARAFSSVGAHALEEGLNVGTLRGVMARYPEVAEHAGNAQWLSEFSQTHPAFTEDVGKELYFAQPKAWTSYGGERGLSGVGVRHSISFARYAHAEAEGRFVKVFEEAAAQIAQNGVDLLPDLVDKLGDDDGVEVKVEGGFLTMQLETPEATYSTKPVALSVVGATKSVGADPRKLLEIEEKRR
jgi:hypothetical protein